MVSKTKTTKQCTATTQKGTRCKWNALPNEKVCHVHIKTRKTDTRKVPEKKVKQEVIHNKTKDIKGVHVHDPTRPGNIYVYTYAHMLQNVPTQTPYLHLAGPTENNWLDKRRTSPFDTSEKVLLKVGYTRKKPEVRVREWKEQCGHSDFVLIYPGCLVPNYDVGRKQRKDGQVSVLRRLMSKLSISHSKKDNRCFDQSNDLVRANSKISHTGRKYKHLNDERTCFVTNNPHFVEQNIHRLLRQKYGTGKLYCEGCMKQKVDSQNRVVTTAGVHTEWFLIPRNQLSFVWELIEGQCN